MSLLPVLRRAAASRLPALSDSTVQLLLVLSAVLGMTLASKVQVPFWPVPVTLQTLALPLIAAQLGSRLGTASVVAYLAAGVAGLPVFANTPPLLAGPWYLLGPTGGYLVASPLAAFLIGWVAERPIGRNPAVLFAAMIAGSAVVLLAGFAWLAFGAQLASGATGIGVEKAWLGGVQPFLLAELVKAALAAAMVTAVASRRRL